KKDTYKTFTDLKGKRIGMENGTTHQKYLQDKHPEVKTVAYDSYQNAIIDLKNGRIDGVFGDTAVVNEWLKTDSLIPALKFRKYDAVISGMDITPERSKQVAFSNPYYANSALVIA
ncbi:transporter substrate-binding domain-containing protein, partial [Salmonella enterica subsp. enterica serovar Paratyphi A]|nr:transporter substrate-binding domain-containing protein [Salmonella enterica subsp. enterica serovar Paratyphi A]